MKLFFAVTLPEDSITTVTKFRDELRQHVGNEGISWEKPANYHITLKFLGGCSEQQYTLGVEAGVMSAASFSPFNLTIGEVGGFPDIIHPKILWLGAKSGFPDLNGLAQLLDKMLAVRGFTPENRTFSPHLTLARVRSEEGERSVASQLSSEKYLSEEVDIITSFEVVSFALMNSESHSGGSIYTVVKKFPLTKV